MARDERGSSAVATSVATALAVLAVLAVLAAATVAGVTYRGGGTDGTTADPVGPGSSTPAGPSTSSAPEPELAFPDGQRLAGDARDNATVDVPSAEEGWTEEGLTVGYQTDDGTTVGTEDPYLLDRGFCTAPTGFEEYRAYVGLTAPISDTSGDDPARDAVDQTLERWLPVVFEGDQEPPEVDYADTEIADGTPARLATMRFETLEEDRDRCSPPATELRFLAFDTGDYVAVVVSSRGVTVDGEDLPDGLGSDLLDEILASARVQEP